MAAACLDRASIPITMLLATLCSCSPAAKFQNPSHPGYGAAEYDKDAAQCRRENSQTVISQGYDLQTTIVVDENKAQACVLAKGWQPIGK